MIRFQMCWINNIMFNYLLIITAMLTHSYCFNIVNDGDVNTPMWSNIAYHTNTMDFTNKTIVKRSPSLPLAIVQGSTLDGPELADSIQLYMYKYPMIKAAHIGTQTFSCRQDTHQLAVAERLPGTRRVIIRMKKEEFMVKTGPGMFWFIRCVGMETGGAGLDVTGVQKPGGDSGIDPNALKSLVG